MCAIIRPGLYLAERLALIVINHTTNRYTHLLRAYTREIIIRYYLVHRNLLYGSFIELYCYWDIRREILQTTKTLLENDVYYAVISVIINNMAQENLNLFHLFIK